MFHPLLTRDSIDSEPGAQQEPSFAVFVNFYGLETPAVADFKLLKLNQ